MFRTSNPTMKPELFSPAQSWDDVSVEQGPSEARVKRAPVSHMTIQGTVNASFFLLAICVGTALLGWRGGLPVEAGGLGWNPMLIFLGGGLGGFVVAMITAFNPRGAMITAPIYAALEGVFVGGISAWYAQAFAQDNGALNTGLIFNAVLLTFGIFGGMLMGYTTRAIRPGPTFNKIVIAATFGIVIYGLIAFVASMFGAPSLASVYDPSNGGLISIGFSLFVVAIASANLILDFQLIEEGAANKAPKYMQWYGGFALLVTLVWLYLEVLRLLAKLQSRD
ncbi:MAG: Bax inhibitor-1/YccA family protein [Planctomycetota bacterium]